MTRISLGYPDAAAELSMLRTRGGADPSTTVEPVTTIDEVLAAQRAVARVHLAEEVGAYLVSIVASTRAHPGMSLGGSPRATLHLASMARARAAMRGRDFVTPDDVAALAGTVLPHRLDPKGRFANETAAHEAAADIVTEIVARTPVR